MFVGLIFALFYLRSSCPDRRKQRRVEWQLCFYVQWDERERNRLVRVGAVGRFTADGAGNLPTGELDSNTVGGGGAAQAFTARIYWRDHRGVMTLNFSGSSTKLAFAMLAMVTPNLLSSTLRRPRNDWLGHHRESRHHCVQHRKNHRRLRVWRSRFDNGNIAPRSRQVYFQRDRHSNQFSRDLNG